MRSIREFVYYYRSCPLCGNWMTLDVDSPLATTLEIKNDGLLLTVIEENREDNKEFFIDFKQNKVHSGHPFVLKSIVNIIKRLYYPDYDESFEIEARFYSCNNFRYWSKKMTHNEMCKKLNNTGMTSYRVQRHPLSGGNFEYSSN